MQMDRQMKEQQTQNKKKFQDLLEVFFQPQKMLKILGARSEFRYKKRLFVQFVT